MTVASMHEISFLTTYVSCYSNNKPKDVTLLTKIFLDWMPNKNTKSSNEYITHKTNSILTIIWITLHTTWFYLKSLIQQIIILTMLLQFLMSMQEIDLAILAPNVNAANCIDCGIEHWCMKLHQMWHKISMVTSMPLPRLNSNSSSNANTAALNVDVTSNATNAKQLW